MTAHRRHRMPCCRHALVCGLGVRSATALQPRRQDGKHGLQQVRSVSPRCWQGPALRFASLPGPALQPDSSGSESGQAAGAAWKAATDAASASSRSWPACIRRSALRRDADTLTQHPARTLIRGSRSRPSGQNIPGSGWITAILIGAVAHGVTIATCLRTRYRRRRATRREAVKWTQDPQRISGRVTLGPPAQGDGQTEERHHARIHPARRAAAARCADGDALRTAWPAPARSRQPAAAPGSR